MSGYLYDMSNSSEVQVAISGGLGEADRGGPAFNIIPKTGGNTFSGTGFTSYAGKWGQSSNIDDHLRSLGFGEQPALIKSYDANIAVGGPILRDRVWFYGNSRAIGTYQEQQNLYVNVNAGNPNAWTWVKADSPERTQLHLQDAERRAPDVAGHAEEQVRVLHRLHEELQRRRLQGRRRSVPSSR